ncbi:MAG: 2-C-methyl-D-erythritol 2,4-cyclodiphosphate synthase [Actinobacteria bacterium RBG_19FT_COMBO_36_27]|nr:MAG: 2-C-methyl-D-erythritol 2,4-cyclodiphosphate synthase [Actinobacteria bacterium RBG_19FT_COMBO_36_27]
MRVGLGFDVHEFKTGRKLILGGVELEHTEGLAGYSDADVLAHSIMDAILGACGLGDIGIHFPDTDIKYKDISSLVLLDKVVKKMKGINYGIVNIDAVLIMQKPKVSKYIPEMKKNIARVLGINEDDINIKATTTEGLGFCGRGEGIAAECVVLLE